MTEEFFFSEWVTPEEAFDLFSFTSDEFPSEMADIPVGLREDFKGILGKWSGFEFMGGGKYFLTGEDWPDDDSGTNCEIDAMFFCPFEEA